MILHTFKSEIMNARTWDLVKRHFPLSIISAAMIRGGDPSSSKYPVTGIIYNIYISYLVLPVVETN